MNTRYRLNVGFVGLIGGFIGQHRLAAVRSVITPGMFVNACVPGPKDKFDKFKPQAEMMGFEPKRIYPTLAAMLNAEPDLDIVVVNTPNFLHEESCLAAAEAGKHIICDKPLAHTLESADQILAAIKQAGVYSCNTPTYTAHPPMLEARHRIRDAGIAHRIRGGRFAYYQDWLAQKQSDMTPNTGSVQAEWRRDPKKSGAGGSSGDLVSHIIHQIESMTGLKITKVCARRRWVVEGEISGFTEDEVVATLILENGAEIQVHSTQWTGGHKNDNQWELWLDKRISFGWNQRCPEILWTTGEDGVKRELNRGDFQSPLLGASQTMPAFHDDGWIKADSRLAQSIGRQVGNCTPEDITPPFHPDFRIGRNVVAVIDAIIRSSNAETPGLFVDVNWID
ncbi:hypothetical protein COT99_02145 [Candidatus Falkowbacteria bacterium CG10_big_fil_rev_8_21_14_0_10_43_10]|uniref:Gfo/Idh/MocA family oxidoreductase n=1 Tax=Candidatus Falkowbacteria bacterium CG10_big_fil_rev_8_21_14_0_10_43_10 TaxID=1974567 RepID=A0A2H0V248_9BACT|nr:MAG: hypothetical protein COT99_02145 [Candidatus Falkowbacteria bacterium CG10_big_fil_rev_8_21_14_0_10_43_10]